MSRQNLLRAAAFLTLFTFLGHTIGGLRGPGSEDTAAFGVYQLMQNAMVTMPFGSPKSLSAIMFGANLCLSFFLFVSGVIFILISRSEDSRALEKQILFFNSLGMLGTGIVSIYAFFPLPAACTGLAGILGLIAIRK